MSHIERIAKRAATLRVREGIDGAEHAWEHLREEAEGLNWGAPYSRAERRAAALDLAGFALAYLEIDT